MVKPCFFQMAYMYATKTREVLSINDLLTKVFNLPSVTANQDIEWLKRPLSQEIMLEAASKVAFLIELQQYLIHRRLLREFYSSATKAMCEISLEEHQTFSAKPCKGNEVINVKFENTLSYVDLSKSMSTRSSSTSSE